MVVKQLMDTVYANYVREYALFCLFYFLEIKTIKKQCFFSEKELF